MLNLDVKIHDDFDGVDRKALTAVRHRFMEINDARLQRAMSVLNTHQQAFLEALPILLHVNHAILPGYVSNNTPSGICGFEPEKAHIRAAKSIANAFSYQSKNEPPSILNISVMGSVGTIAHSRKSDMDFWVCYDSRLSDEELAELQQKLTSIERWAEGLGLEIYFFLMNAEQFRQGQRRGVSGEDCGSAQHYLLLDEYYRTGLIVAGRPPAWWVVPSEQEKHYDDFLKKAYQYGEIKPHEFIDFGGIPVFPAGEFIGAGMWQLYKGIEAPYKSVLKIMLTEVYASEYPDVSGLSLLYKSAIHRGETDLDALDPYIMLYRKIEGYLLKRQESERLELLRKCLYLKVNEVMSRPPPKTLTTWKRQSMQSLVAQWAWGVPLVYLLDNRKNWKVQQVTDQRKILVDELNFSYRFLSRFARENGFSALINDKDMSLLGRKLYAAFERKSGKIEYINPNIAPNITEEHLTILREFNPGKSGLMVGNWAVFAGVVKQAERDEIKPIKRSRSIVEILAWCYFNHIIDGATRFTLSAGETNLSDQELRKILGCFNILYPDRLSMASQESFHHGARPQQITLIINVGVDPMAKMNRKGYQRITEQTDALNFSGLHQNLVVTIDQITKNTWHEVSTMHFDGDQSVIDCVLDFMRNHVPGKHSMPKIDILCYSPTRPKGICQRLEHLFEGILETYYRRKHRLETRYILVVGNKYFIFQFRNQQPIVKSVASLSALMRYLSAPQKEFSPIIFDAYAHPRDTLPFLVRKNSPDVVQVFYRKLETKITFYIFDEKGSLITFHESDIQEKPFLRKLYRFFQSIESRRQQACVAGGGVEKVYKVSFYEVVQGDPFAIETRVVSASIEDERYHNIEVIVERSSDDEQHYTIFCDHQEFSEYQYGKGIFKAVAQHILKQRKGQAPYPVTITSLDLASVTQAQESLQTAYYLQQKLALEWQINRTLKESAD